jgi:hypothetical protein
VEAYLQGFVGSSFQVFCGSRPLVSGALKLRGFVCFVLSGVLIQVEMALGLGPPRPCLALHLPPPVIQVLPYARTVILWPCPAIPLHALAASASTAWRPRRALHLKTKYYHHWRLLKGEVQFSGMPLPVPLPTVRPCAQLGSMACVMAMSADATFSGTVLLCPFSFEQPHDIADGMYVQVSAALLTGCLAAYAEVHERAVRVCVDGACGTECYDMHMYLLWLVAYL